MELSASHLKQLICTDTDAVFTAAIDDLQRRRVDGGIRPYTPPSVLPGTRYTPINYILQLETTSCRYPNYSFAAAPNRDQMLEATMIKNNRIARMIAALYHFCGAPSRPLTYPPPEMINLNPLALAIQNDNIPAVNVLLTSCSPVLEDAHDRGLLHHAVYMHQNEMVAALAGHDLPLQFFDASYTDPHTGNTALHEAARQNNAEAILLLIRFFRGDPSQPNHAGHSPLALATDARAIAALRVI